MSRRVLVLSAVLLVALGGLFFVLRPDGRSNEPERRSVDVEIREGAMSPSEISVREGDQVTLRMSADEPVEFHMHGYDLAREVGPDEPAELSFEADITGQFEIEDEQSQTELGKLVVEPR